MKADNVQSMDNSNAEMEYITLPTAGIQLTDGQEQPDPNAYQSPENGYVQNPAYSGVGNFGYGAYTADPNYSYCCGFDSNGSNSVQASQSYAYATQPNPNQVEYQYEYVNQPNMTQYYNMNRVAGGTEDYAAAPSTSAASYPSAASYSTAAMYPSSVNYPTAINYLPAAGQSSANMESYACNLQQAAASSYYSMPMGMTQTQASPEYWYSPQKTTDNGSNNMHSQSVYRSDFQPIYSIGNNFNHFPNNSFMDKKLFLELVHSYPEQQESVPQSSSYKYGDATCDAADDQINGNYVSANVSNMQMQHYPVSNDNYAQMCTS